jgi:hypothetical protein
VGKLLGKEKSWERRGKVRSFVVILPFSSGTSPQRLDRAHVPSRAGSIFFRREPSTFDIKHALKGGTISDPLAVRST